MVGESFERRRILEYIERHAVEYVCMYVYIELRLMERELINQLTNLTIYEIKCLRVE